MTDAAHATGSTAPTVASGTAATPLVPAPDTKDWTWVLGTPCPECGYDAALTQGRDVPAVVERTIAAFTAALQAPDAAVRALPQVWSPLEYACHVRDVFALFAVRTRAMLIEYDPLFADWDQDATALEQRYWAQDPATVAAELTDNGLDLAEVYGDIDDDEWSRPGRRSNGSTFTVDSLGRYLAHDLVHHCHDIGAD